MKTLLQKKSRTTGRSRSKKRWIILAVLALMAIIVIPQFAFAQGTIPFSSPEIEKIYQQMVSFLLVIMEFMQRLIWPVLLMIGGLLKTDILYSAGMEEAMLAIWTNIRNIVNILFVLILLGIAFYNVMGGKQQDYHIKAILPKFVIALIAVNFSFLMVKVLVDGVSVVTTAIFALPDAVERDLTDPDKDPNLQKSVCEGIYGKFEEGNYETAVNNASQDENKPFCNADSPTLTDDAKKFFTTYDSNNAAIVLAVNIAQINNLPTVKSGVANIKNLGINVLFSIVLYIVYATAFVALLIILLVRLVALWLAAVLSPLLFLKAVLPENMKSSFGGGDDLGKQLIQTAIAPIPIAIVMSIGFIMLTTLKSAQFGAGNTLGASTLGVSMLTSGLSTLQDVIAAVGTVVFIWVGVFKAASGTAAQGIVDGIKGSVEGFAKFAATAPIKYAPLFPTYTVGEKGELKEGPKISLAGAKTILPGIMSARDQAEQEKVRGIIEAWGGQDAFKHIDAMKQTKTAPELAQAMANARGNTNKKWQEEMDKHLKANPKLKNELEWKVTYGAGTKYKKQEDFEKALAAGNADQDTVNRWIDANQKKFNVQQQFGAPAAAKPEEGGAAGKPAAPAAAAAVVERADQRMSAPDYNSRSYALSKDEQAKLNAVRDAKDPAAAEAAAQDPAVQGALDKVNTIAREQGDFATDLAGAVAKKDSKKVDDLIRQRRQAIKTKLQAGGVTDRLDERANAIMAKEINAMPEEMKKEGEAQTVLAAVQAATPDALQAPTPIARAAAPAAPGKPAPAAPAARRPAAPPPKAAAPPPAAPAGPQPMGVKTLHANGRTEAVVGQEIEVDGVKYIVVQD